MSQPFSHIYRQPDELRTDDARVRYRLAKLINAIPKEDLKLGSFLEENIGIRFIEFGYQAYVSWETIFADCEIADLFDIIYYTAQFIGRIGVRENFLSSVNRIFDERQFAYVVDQEGTVHPRVDPVFFSESVDILQGLNGDRYGAARAHVQNTLDQMADNNDDFRQPIRSAFDAVENIYKIIFPRVTHLNARTIGTELSNLLSKRYEAGSVELRASEKMRDSFKEWVASAHNYRHAGNSEKIRQPPQEIAILLISNGFSFVRWLAALDRDE